MKVTSTVPYNSFTVMIYLFLPVKQIFGLLLSSQLLAENLMTQEISEITRIQAVKTKLN